MAASLDRSAEPAVPSLTQEASWFVESLAGNGPARTRCRVFRVTGPLNPRTLRTAWHAVVARHDILRTRPAVSGGRLRQEPVADRDTSFVEVDELDAEKWATAPFPHPPLARLVLAKSGRTDHVVMIVLHHTIADQESVSIVAEDLFAAYAAGAGTPPAASRPYAEYARWQRDLTAGPVGGQRREWWTSVLRPTPPTLQLPLDRPRPAALDTRAGTVRFDWPDAARLTGMADGEDVPPSAVLLAALLTLLWRYGDENRIAVGMPVPVRPPRFSRTVGPCTNQATVVTDFSDRPTVRQLLRRVARQAEDAIAHADLPFADVVRAVAPPRDPHRIPWHDVVFDFRADPAPTLPDTTVTPCPVRTSWTASDIELTVTPDLSGTLTYRADILDHASACHFLDQLHAVLLAVLSTPDLPVDALRWGPAAGPPSNTDVHLPRLRVDETVRANGKRGPGTCAVSYAGHDVSYRDIVRQAGAIAEALPDAAASSVVVRIGPGPLRYAALLGVLEAGAHIVWYGTDDPGERGRAVLSDLRPAYLLLDCDPAEDALAEWYRDTRRGQVLDVRGLGQEPRTRTGISDHTLTDLAYVAYTSGSTGTPKGIPQTHAALAQFADWFATQFDIGPGARVAQWVAPEHDPALAETFAALVAGATLCPVPARVRSNPDRLATWLADEAITHVQLVPSFAKELLGAIIAQGLGDRMALGHLLLMGEALSEDIARSAFVALPGVRVVNLYGPTETVAATWHELTAAQRGPAPIGNPIPGREVVVVDAADQPCPPGVTGEIVVVTPYVTPGYTGAAATDRAAFTPLRGRPTSAGTSYRTGDLGRWRWDGALEFRGRKDFQVKLAGHRVELSEIESVVAGLDAVAECAARAVTDHAGRTVSLAIYVVPRDDATADSRTPAALRAHLRRVFGALRLPTTFTVLDAPLPRTVAGKVDRRLLPTPAPAPGESWTPATPVHRGLARIWTELTGAPPKTADETFFQSGGHSLLLPRFAHLIRDRFGAGLSLRDIAANLTIDGLAALIGDHSQPQREWQHHNAV